MLKVVIADDEERICRLIKALVDWDGLGMLLVGTASNGFEAIDLVKEWHPDILVTDIRMPGCDGLQMIEQVKQTNSELEIIIISGFAHFPYAQTAIRFGIGDYLLKPVNKVELNQTLKKLGDKIRYQKAAESDRQQMVEHTQLAKNRMRTNLIGDLLDKSEIQWNEALLRDIYQLDLKSGILQPFCIKLDYDLDTNNTVNTNLIATKIRDVISGKVQSYCQEIIFDVRDYCGFGILQYQEEKKKEIKRILRDCLNLLVMQKNVLGGVEFSLSLGSIVKNPSNLAISLQETRILVDERLVIGTECLIETMPPENGLQDKNILEKYVRMIPHAIEIYSKEESRDAVNYMKENIPKHIRGSEVFDLIISAGTVFLMQLNLKDQKEVLEKFKADCNQCGSITQLFSTLESMQEHMMIDLQNAHESDALRPIRLARQYIQSHYKEQITLEEVSDVVGLSTSYFSALFKKEIGEGFAKYLINIRMEEAKRLLRETNDSVSMICEKVGYHDLKHFTRTFEKASGLKPSAYRKLYG